MISRDPVKSEHHEQREFVSWFRKKFGSKDVGKDVRIIAIPNGGARAPAVALKMKLEGVLPGVPDLWVPRWRLVIEMKKIGGQLASNQKEMIEYFKNQCGYHAMVCFGCDDAKRQVDEFLAFMKKNLSR